MGGLVLAATAAQNSGGWEVVAAVLVAVGAYFILAAFVENLPAPGRAKARRQLKKRNEAFALLVEYHTTCIVVRDREVTEEQFKKWFGDLSIFVEDAWGKHQRSALAGGIWNGGNFYRFNEIEVRISRLIDGVDAKEVRSTFDPDTVAKPHWLILETTPGPAPQLG